MKRISVLFASFSLLFLFSCNDENETISPEGPVEQEAITLEGAIEKDMILKPDHTYHLKGQVYVKNNATLTIPAGVTVFADSEKEKAALIITQGSKLFVNGTANSPVVFTSGAKTKAPGDWAGIVIMGKAPVNLENALVPGLPAAAEANYGGEEPDDNSGAISYLRLEYTGGLNPANEEEWQIDKASGLCLAGVGAGTQVNNVMVKYSRDDAFQFLGGTVNAKYLIAYNNGDDDFDFDRGYRGKLQFLISYRTQATTHALRANAMESLNDFDAFAPEPHTRPVISNMTIIGPQGSETQKTNLNQGIYIRKATRFAVRNSIIAEYPQGGLMVCQKTRPILLNNTGSEFKYNLVHSDNTARAFTYDRGPDGVHADYPLAEFAANSINQNEIISSLTDLKLVAPYASGAPDFTQQHGSMAASGANFSGSDYNTFFTPIAFRGAVGQDNWPAAGNWVSWK